MQFNYSVIIPYRDKYNLLIKGINSIPDRSDIQIIIVDNTPQPLSCEQVPIKHNCSVVYTISSPTKGAGGARNEGLKYAEGKYLLFLDADDYFTPDAFSFFDAYVDKKYDIVFFKPTSIKLNDGTSSNRHVTYANFVDSYLSRGEEDNLRFWYTVPWGKMISTYLVRKHSIQFDETFASNDLMFSVKTGFYASNITASTDVVYVVTESGAGGSIDKTKTKEAQFARYTVAVSQYEFMSKVGRKDQRFSLLSYILRSWKDFGFSEFLKYLHYARSHRANIFVNLFK